MALVIAAVIVVIVVAFTARPTPVAKPHKPTTFTASGTFDLTDTADGGACDPPAGYTDLATEAQVIISAGGHTVALGELGVGVEQDGGLTCHYTFSVKHVPLGYKFYGVEITHRGAVQESAADMQDGNVALVIGS